MDNNTVTVWKADAYVGRTTDRGRMFVEAYITREMARPDQQDTDHKPVTDHYYELHITGEWFPFRCRTPHSLGQNTGHLANVLDPAPGWTIDDVEMLHQIWQHWHLNAMQAGCKGMPKFVPNYGYNDGNDNWDQRPECPLYDYRWGQAWLVKRLPEDVIARLKSLPWDNVKENNA